MKRSIWYVLLLFLSVLVILGCSVGQTINNVIGNFTPTPTLTATPTSTPTPIPTATPTDTPIPTATPLPSPEQVLLDNNFTQDTGSPTCDGLPCRTYTNISIDSSGFAIMWAAILDSGEFRIGYAMTQDTASGSLTKTIAIVRTLYGEKVADWFSNHFAAPTSVTGGRDVVDGHWVEIGWQKIDDKTAKIIMVVAPDENMPSEINP